MMYRDHIVANKRLRNVSPNIAAAPFRDQLAARREGFFGCFLFHFIPVTSLIQQTGKIYTMVFFNVRLIKS